MARTYRHRHSAPKGWVMRDGESWTLHEEGTGKEHPRSYRTLRTFARGICRREKKAYRKEHNRQYRAKVRQALHREDWEGIPRFRRTSGWLTW